MADELTWENRAGDESRGAYRILDEPQPGALEQWATRPFWPLLAVMLGGVWLSWPWFIFNAFALGTPTRRREAVTAAAGIGVLFAMFFGQFWAFDQGWLTKASLPYVNLLPVVFKLGLSYWLFTRQEASADLWEYFGGEPKNGSMMLFLGFFATSRLQEPLVALSPLLWLVLS